MPSHTRVQPARLAILDWSGVLIDELDLISELHSQVIRQFSRSHITPTEWKRRIGARWTDLYQEEGIAPHRLETAARYFCDLYAQNLARLQPIDGASDLITELRERHIPIVIVSNQHRQCIEAMANSLGWTSHIDRVIAAEGLDAPKDTPASFWAVLRDYGCDPQSAFVVDDMRAGIALARTAGMVAVGVNSSLDHDLTGADVRVDTLREILPALDK